MDNNEIMNYEDIEVMEDVDLADEKSGMGTGVAMLIGAGLTLAVGAGVKLVKKGIAAYKAKKALRQYNNENHDFCVDNQDVEEVETE